jgi:molybdopterin molybdotransferase
MLTAQQALDHLLSHAKPVTEVVSLPMQVALGRVLAEDVLSLVDVPPLNNTSMDGYAVRTEDIAAPGVVLEVTQRIPAGSLGKPLEPGTAARIFTGAPIPAGTDAIVMQEDCTLLTDSSDQTQRVQINLVPKAGQWIRYIGEDLSSGKTALSAGTFLRPQELGVAASGGLTHLTVKRQVRVAAFFTGDELALPGQPLKPGGVYNSNRDTLLACLKSLGCEATDLGIVPDRLEATREALRRASKEHDLIITSGGVSVGEEDHIKPAVTAEGHLDLWQIAIKPGKPLAFGAVRKSSEPKDGEAWFIGLPGNPVSSFVTFLLFVRPFILQLQGRQANVPQTYPMRADFDWPKADRRNEFLRVKINAQGGLNLFPNQSSGVLTSVSWGDGLVDCPPGQAIQAGDIVRYIPFNTLLA